MSLILIIALSLAAKGSILLHLHQLGLYIIFDELLKRAINFILGHSSHCRLLRSFHTLRKDCWFDTLSLHLLLGMRWGGPVYWIVFRGIWIRCLMIILLKGNRLSGILELWDFLRVSLTYVPREVNRRGIFRPIIWLLGQTCKLLVAISINWWNFWINRSWLRLKFIFLVLIWRWLIFRIPKLRVIILNWGRLILISSLRLSHDILIVRYEIVLVAGFFIEQLLLVFSIDQSLWILAEQSI